MVLFALQRVRGINVRKRIVVVLLAALVSALGMAAPASAAVTQLNVKTQWLTDAPEDWMGTSCVSRTLTLGGTYEWGDYYSDSYGTEYRAKRTISLGYGSYTWKDCLDPKNGYYVRTSTLDPANPDWATAKWVVETWRFYGPSGSKTWGSYLYH